MFRDLTWLFTCDVANRGIVRLNFDEAAMLHRYAEQARGPVLEIGRRHGGSTCVILDATAEHVYSIDIAPSHVDPVEPFFHRHADRLTLLVGNSREPIEALIPWGTIFIDGDHSYEGVKADIEAHWPQLAVGGAALFHDYHLPDVKRAFDGAGLKVHEQAGSMVCAIKS